MKELWLEAFPEDTDFVNVFFEKFYRPSRAFLRYDGKTLVSMLFYMDIKLKYKRKVYKGAYLYGVATKTEERNAGHFSALHDFFAEKLKTRKYKFILTLPSSDSLFPMYKKFGYTSYFRKTEYSISTLDFEEISVPEAWERHLADFKSSSGGIKLLESRDMFLESAEGHRFLGFDGGYFAFVKKNGRYIMYDVCDPLGKAPRHELIHYERSAVFLDLSSGISTEIFEKEKPVLNFLMN